MRKTVEQHQRRSLRLPGYDYSQKGAYFITICTQNRECMFGDIADGEMRFNDAGRMAQKVWDELASRFHTAELDEYVIMPNHIHGIMIINGRGESCIRPDNIKDDKNLMHEHNDAGEHKVRPYGGNHEQPNGTLDGTIGRMITAFKSISTHEYIIGVEQSGGRHFPADYGNVIFGSILSLMTQN